MSARVLGEMHIARENAPSNPHPRMLIEPYLITHTLPCALHTDLKCLEKIVCRPSA